MARSPPSRADPAQAMAGTISQVREHVPDCVVGDQRGGVRGPSLLSPALTTVRQQPFELGKKATETVMSLAPGPKPVSYVFEPEIMLRDSVRDISRSTRWRPVTGIPRTTRAWDAMGSAWRKGSPNTSSSPRSAPP